jgi:hypothetical protein
MSDLLQAVAGPVAHGGQTSSAQPWFAGGERIGYDPGFTPGRDSSSTQSRRTGRAPRRPLPCRRRGRSSL